MSVFINYWTTNGPIKYGLREGDPLKWTRVENTSASRLKLGAYLYVVIIDDDRVLLVGRMLADEFRLKNEACRSVGLSAPLGSLEVVGIGGGTPIHLQRVLSQPKIKKIVFDGEDLPRRRGQSMLFAGYIPYGIRRINLDSAMILDNVIDLGDDERSFVT